ncbi:MAG TPA: M1 family metallopeptidase [Daejeonella sp.]|nr:M1 family metallopeptidase [Daejeonella sp.]
MKLKFLICCHFVAAFFLAACSTTHKATLDPVRVTENAAGVNYRGSYTKLTDIIHTRLDLSFNWDSAHVIGKATIDAKPYFYPSDNLVLDARGFRINSVSLKVKEEKTPLRYTYDGKQITIQLGKTYNNNQKYTVFIDYVAMPYNLKVGEDISSAGDRGLYFVNRDGKQKDQPRQIWTQGETECNSNWFPTINGPQEKMTQELNITVADEFVTLSNGSLEYTSMNGDGTRTDSWRQELPHSTYLTMLAVGDFAITRDKWREKEVNYYTEPAFAPTAKLVFGKTPEMMEFFSKKMGVEYPWDKYSQIVVRNFVSGAMENTTATVFFDRMNMTEGQYLDANYEDIIAHELFHHWFGDLVTAESWANLPLNEAFATYGEYLWFEFKYGRESADLKALEDANAYFNSSRQKQVDVIRYNYADREQMFDEVTYQKGGRILHMLRKTVGDDAFFKALNLYLTRHAYKTAEVHDLRIVFEEVTGQDLNWFFNQWFLASGHPVLAIQTAYDAEKNLATVSIQQNQDLSVTPLYRIPMAVDIYAGGKVERKMILLNQQSQSFSFTSTVMPDLINVDAEKYVLATKIDSKSLQQNIFQYKNAPLFMDRFEALSMIQRHKNEANARQAMIGALADSSPALRQVAVDFSSNLQPNEKQAVYQKIREIAIKDPVSSVRAAAVRALSKAFAGENNTDVFEQTAKDKAPSVIKATLEARK